ncbi:MAG TPA: ribonuclease H-like domain-containing protein, partial [Polyangiales bacterium]|nr:ribonuclease H-like domain-containing protein [Polyangiales bacterium]
MDLRAKLSRLRSSHPALTLASALPEPEPEPELPSAFERAKAERIAKLRALIGAVAVRDEARRVEPAHELLPREAPKSRALPWCRVETSHGALHKIERWLEPDHHHGRAPLMAAMPSRIGTVSLLTGDPSLAELDVSRALFLDTETTGLAGGTGTVAFLVGLARFEDGALMIEQLIVPELGCERPVLARLAECIASASCLVTYNGKSFDWPLLRTRFVLSRMTPPPLAAHVDLLHAARAVWKDRMASVRLTEVEREILHFERDHDIPGAEIPARYFAYLRDGDAERLSPVLEHNQNDLIALAALLGALVTRCERVEALEHAGDALAFGKLALRARDAEQARRCAQAALLVSGAHEALSAQPARDLARRALLFASEIEKRRGDSAQAAMLLEHALTHTSDLSLRAAIHVGLAKLYE